MKETKHLAWILGAVLVLGFQNCGKYQTLEDVNPSSEDFNLSNNIKSNEEIGENSTNTSVPAEPVPSRFVRPLAIEFGEGDLQIEVINPPPFFGCHKEGDLVFCAMADNPSEKTLAQMPIEPWVHQTHYAYRLEIRTGFIVDALSGEPIGALSADEKQTLRSLLRGSVLTNIQQLLGGDIMCAMVMVEGYATLLTNAGSFELGAGSSSCVTDLFSLKTKNPVGLKEFLARIAERIEHGGEVIVNTEPDVN
jgi:hypothetical protein